MPIKINYYENKMKHSVTEKARSNQNIDDFLYCELEKVPSIFFKKLLTDKLEEKSIPPSIELIDDLYNHFISENNSPFYFDHDKNGNIKLHITDDDFKELHNKISDFYNIELPRIINNTTKEAGKGLYFTLKKDWKKEHKLQTEEYLKFKKNLLKRWRGPLELLRMLLTIARELGDAYISKHQNNSESHYLPYVLSRLHCRACQVSAEIIALLEGGYADGAMARWRTLHEITTIAFVIEHYGEEIAERYIAHEVIESKHAMDDYIRYAEHLENALISENEKETVSAEYDAAIKKYGKAFDSHYGWAAYHLNKNKVTLFNLEEIAKRESLRPHYKMASYNVHATVKGIFCRLSDLDEQDHLISGASNAGLDEPGINTAITLCQISSLLLGNSESMTLEETIMLSAIIEIRNEIIKQFQEADYKLQQDHKLFEITTS